MHKRKHSEDGERSTKRLQTGKGSAASSTRGKQATAASTTHAIYNAIPAAIAAAATAVPTPISRPLPSSGTVTTKSLYQKLPNTLLKASGITPAAAHGGAPGAALVQSLVVSVLPGGTGAAASTSSTGAGTGTGAGGGGGGAGASTSASNYEKKIKDKQLTIENAIKSKGPSDRALSGSASRERARQARLEQHTRLHTLNAREKRALKLYALPDDDRYDTYVPLHRLWCSYIEQLLGDDLIRGKTAGCEAKLLKADYHGALVTVIRSTSPTLIGLSGIVVQETAQTFKIVTQPKPKTTGTGTAATAASTAAGGNSGGGFKSIPKRNTVFSVPLQLQLPAPATTSDSSDSKMDTTGSVNATVPAPAGPVLVATLYGSQLCLRPADRIAKKFKSKNTIQLN